MSVHISPYLSIKLLCASAVPCDHICMMTYNERARSRERERERETEREMERERDGDRERGIGRA